MHLRLTHKERHQERSPSCLHIARADLTATLLTNSQVLVVGGLDTNYNVLARAESYTPASAKQAGFFIRCS